MRPAETIRAFYALWPDAAARNALAALAAETALRTGGRAPRPANLHITAAFVGDVATSRLANLREVGAAVARKVPAFGIALDRTGTFRGTGIAWAGPSRAPAPILQLARLLADALAAEGFAVERRDFSPHVTLVRRSLRPANAAIAAPISWTATRIALCASENAAGGPRYRDLESWPLGGAESEDPVS